MDDQGSSKSARSSVRGIASLTGVFVVSLLANTAWADWKIDYDRGLKAYEQQQWAEAEQHFKSAIEGDPATSAMKRFQGSRMRLYAPHHFAGLAAAQQGDCARAESYWSDAATVDLVQKRPELASAISNAQDRCRQTALAATAPPGAPAGVPSVAATERQPTPAPVLNSATAKQSEANIPAQVTTPTVPPTLKAAINDYLALRYEAVLQPSPASLPDERSRGLLHLLRAAAQFNLAYRQTQGVPALELARTEVRAAKAANATLQPASLLFSERFRGFWASVR